MSPSPSLVARSGLIAVLLLVPACSGAESSDLMVAPAAAVSEPPSSSSSVPTRDAGAGIGSQLDASTALTTDANDAVTTDANDAGDGSALGAGDSATPATDTGADAAADAQDAAVYPTLVDAGPPGCALAGKAASTIDDGSWPGPNAAILPQCGRAGIWYVQNDGTSTQFPGAGGPFGPFLTDTPPSTAKGYVRTSGTLSQVSNETHDDPHWGAEIGFDLDAANGAARPYDLTAGGYHGFTFWVRIGSANQLTPIWFDVPTSETISYTDGAFHSFSFAAPAAGVWTEITVPFTDLTQPAWTPPNERVPFDAAAAISVQWNFDSAANTSLAFDVSIGDVELW